MNTAFCFSWRWRENQVVVKDEYSIEAPLTGAFDFIIAADA